MNHTMKVWYDPESVITDVLAEPKTEADVAEAFDDLPAAIEQLLPEGAVVTEEPAARKAFETVIRISCNLEQRDLKSSIVEAFRYHGLYGKVI